LPADSVTEASVDQERELRRLRVFQLDARGFRLGLAVFTASKERDLLIGRLREILAVDRVQVSVLDVAAAPAEATLLGLVRAHRERSEVPAGWREALHLVGLESRLAFHYLPGSSSDSGHGFFAEANLHRESLARAYPSALVLWLTESASLALGQAAADLWHWRSASFDFTSSQTRVEAAQGLIRASESEATATEATHYEVLRLERELGEMGPAGAEDTPQSLAHRVDLLLRLGKAYRSCGRLAESRRAFNRARELAVRLLDEHREARACSGLGITLSQSGRHAEAARAFGDGLAILEKLAVYDPGNSVWQRDLSISYVGLGDVAVAQGKLAEAAREFGDGLAIAKKLAAGDPSNSEWQRDLSISYNRLGDVAVAQGKLEEAARSFGDGLAIARKLAAGDPSNSQWQCDLSISYNRLGGVAVAQGKLEEAARAFGDGLAIAKKLAAGDPSNSEWQRDLSISYSRLGDVAMAQGKLEEAAWAFGDALAIAKKFAAGDPGNSEWQRDLSISYERLGEVAMAQGKLEEAARAFGDALAIAKKLAAGDPGNSQWQRDLSISFTKLATVAEKREQSGEAMQHWSSAFEALSTIESQGLHLLPGDRNLLEQIRQKLTALNAIERPDGAGRNPAG